MQDNKNSCLDKDSSLQEATPSNISRDNIESLAEKISNQFKLTDFSVEADPLLQFVRMLGGQIHYQNPTDFCMSESGSIEVRGQNNFDLYLSTFTGPLRDRFTIAHELGHYFVHSKQGELPIRASRKGSGQLEWEANWFAAALLMPSDEFTKISDKFDGDVYSIAGHFQVSSQAVTIRQKRVK
jgi:Zn-dependent peptidase ImmA (M78 family)